MTVSVTSLRGIEVTIPDGSKHKLNFKDPALFTDDKKGCLRLGITLNFLDYSLKIDMQVRKQDGEVMQQCVATHKATGAVEYLPFTPDLQADLTSLTRRPVPLREVIKQYPESRLYGAPAAPDPFPGTRKFPSA